MMMLRNLSLPKFFVITLFICMVLLSYLRLYFGVNFTDESFYIALPYRFILGNIPIKDEYSICQFAGIILYPFYSLYLHLNQSTDAIVLFARHLYLLFYAILTALCFFTLKKELKWKLALLTASVCLAFTFCNIAGLSYNTLAIFFLAIACFCNFAIYQNFHKPQYYFFAGLCFSLTAFVYPPLLIMTLLALILLCIKNWRYTLSYFVLGTIPVLILVIFIVHAAGLAALNNIYVYLHNTGYINQHTNHIHLLINTWKLYTPDKALLGILLIIYLLTYTVTIFIKSPTQTLINSLNITRLISGLAITVILLASYALQDHFHNDLPIWWDPITDCYVFLINICLLMPIYILILIHQRIYYQLFESVWVPSIIAGIITGLASANSIANCMIGLFPALIASIIILGQANKKLCYLLLSSKFKIRYDNYLPYVITIAVLIILFINKYNFVYQDEPLNELSNNSVSHLKQQIKEGPFKYLYTTTDIYRTNQLFITDLRSLIVDHAHIRSMLIYPGFSAGYLYSNLLPTTNSVWLFDLSDKSSIQTITYLQNNHSLPDVFCNTKNINHNYLINYLLHSNYSLAKSSDSYKLYIRNNIAQTSSSGIY